MYRIIEKINKDDSKKFFVQTRIYDRWFYIREFNFLIISLIVGLSCFYLLKFQMNFKFGSNNAFLGTIIVAIGLLTTVFGVFGILDMGPILFRRTYFRKKEDADQDIKDRIQNKIRKEEIKRNKKRMVIHYTDKKVERLDKLNKLKNI